MMIDFNTQFAPCPRCSGTVYVARYVEGCLCYDSMRVVCDNCGLQLEYSTELLRTPKVRWTYVLQNNDSIFDVWEKGGLDEFKPDE